MSKVVNSESTEKKSKFKSLDVTLFIVFLLFIAHSIEMFYLYNKFGTIPEAYACAIVTALIGECGICGRIYNVKLKAKLEELKLSTDTPEEYEEFSQEINTQEDNFNE